MKNLPLQHNKVELMSYSSESDMLSKISCGLIGNVFNFTLSQFPNVVQIETTNACNAKCIICPHNKMQRPVRYMEDELFTGIIDECAEFNCNNVHLHNFGEPLLDKKMSQRVRYAKKKGIKKVKIFSNGSLLDAQRANDLIDAGLDEIKISFDGATKEEYEKIRYPLDFDKVVNNIKELVKIRDKKKSHLKIIVTCCSTSDKNETIRILEDIVDGFSFDRVHNWADPAIAQDKRNSVRKPCSRIWRTFTVLSTGDAALCCLDYEGKVIVGNVMEKSLKEIWHGVTYQKMRLYHKNSQQHEISICSNCTKSFW